MDFPLAFPTFPGPGPPNNNVETAFQLISEAYNHSSQLLSEEDNPIPLNFHLNCLQNFIFPLYTTLSTENIPMNWLVASAHLLGQLLVQLQTVIKRAEDE